MFPLKANDPYIKETGERSTLGKVVGGGSDTPELPDYSIADAGKVLKVGDDGTLEWDENGAGGGDAFLSYDFTKYGERTVSGVSFSSSGALFTTANANINTAITSNDITVYIDVDALNIVAGTNKRLLMASDATGLIYRSTGYWGVYASNNWMMTDESDATIFDGSKIKVYIDENNYWHIYKNNELFFEPNAAVPITSLVIGSTTTSINGAILTGVRIYDGDYTE